MNRFVFSWLLAGLSILQAAEHRGVVKSSGTPVPGATVSAEQGGRKLTTWTNDSGEYQFEDLASGKWSIEVTMTGFIPAIKEIDPASGPAEWNLDVKSLPARSGPPQRQGAFQQLALQQSVQNEVQAALAAPQAAGELSGLEQNANESFLVSGSLSRGLESAQREDTMNAMREDFRQRFEGMGGPPGSPGFEGGMPGQPLGPGSGFGERRPGGPPGGPPGGGMMMGGGPPPGGGPPGGGPPVGMMGGGPLMGGPSGRGGETGRGSRGDRRRGPGGFSPEGREAFFGNRMRGSRDLFHGGAFFTLRNSALDATPYSLSGEAATKPSYSQTNFGFAGGGTLRIPKLVTDDKTFFFANYSGARGRNPFSQFATLPLASERSGDFSDLSIRGAVTVYDPLNGQPFPGSRIPLSRQDPAARALLEYIPLPNLAGAVRNYQAATSTSQGSDNFGLRLNRGLTNRDRVSGSYNFQRRDGESAQLFGFADETSGRGQSFDLTWTRNIQAGLINNLRFRFSRNRTGLTPYFAYKRDVAEELGIQGVSHLPADWGPPNLSFTNFGNLTDGSASLRRDQTASISEGLIRAHGKHTLSAGFEYRRMQLNTLSHQNGRGTFTFSGIGTSGYDTAGNPMDRTGFDLADFLLGYPQSSSVRFGSADIYFRGSSYNAHAQDDWRLRSNLTLNAGLRYEFNTPLHEKYGRMANLDIAPGFTGVAVVTPGAAGTYSGAFPDGLIDPDRNNFSPRFGLAWKPLPGRSTLVRGGYGIYYNGSIYNQAASRMAQQPPFAKSASVQTSAGNPLTIVNGFTVAPKQQITNTFAVARDYRTGYAQTWNLSVQQDLPFALMMELGYLGTKGTRLDIQRLPNRAAPGPPLTAEDRRAIGNAVGFTLDSSEGNSIYHAAQVRVARRFRHGVSMNALYVWGRSIDNASTLGGGGAVVAQNDRDLAAERGLSSFDRRHTLNLNWVVTTGFGRGGARSGVKNVFLKDWTWSGGITARSGGPFTATVLGNRSDSGGTGAAGNSRADATGLPVHAGDGFFNTLAFALPASGQYGNAGRNTIPGPGFFAANMSLGRTIPLGENRRVLELRAEAANVFNSVSISRIGTTVNSVNYGLATGAADMRTLSVSLRVRF